MNTNMFARGDKVAVVSPSSGIAGLFPWVFDLGLKRLTDIFGVEVVEYPTTRQYGSSLIDRARDVNAAFSDKEIKAIFTTIGGEDQVQLLKYLDQKTIRANPKPFFGYSDNTNIHQLLWKLGTPSYYGGAVMTQFAMSGEMDELTRKSIDAAVARNRAFVVESSAYVKEKELSWDDPGNLRLEKQREPSAGFIWDTPSSGMFSGKLWGGCVESMIAQLGADLFVPSAEELRGAVLFFETAEDIPEHWIVEYFLMALGERGILKDLSAILIGRPKTWAIDKQLPEIDREKYRTAQVEMVVKIVRQYNREVPIVQNMNFGHTDPQIIVPMGNKAYVDTENKIIKFNY